MGQGSEGEVFYELSKLDIDKEFVSRGTEKTVKTSEATAFDVMPRIIGNEFRKNQKLRRNIHYPTWEKWGFLQAEGEYKKLSEEKLDQNDLVEGLEAYKRSLNNALGFISAMSLLGDESLVKPSEIEGIDLSKYFELEKRLIEEITPSKFHIETYKAFVNEVGEQKKGAHDLNQLFFTGGTGRNPLKRGDPEIGERLKNAYARALMFYEASWISCLIGDYEASDFYAKLHEQNPPLQFDLPCSPSSIPKNWNERLPWDDSEKIS